MLPELSQHLKFLLAEVIAQKHRKKGTRHEVERGKVDERWKEVDSLEDDDRGRYKGGI